jgi:hypothetical protein
MTAKEKANQLVDKFIWNCKHTEYVDDNRYKDSETIRVINSKQCALICVDEILELQLELSSDANAHNIAEFYKEVKQEIIKL